MVLGARTGILGADAEGAGEFALALALEFVGAADAGGGFGSVGVGAGVGVGVSVGAWDLSGRRGVRVRVGMGWGVEGVRGGHGAWAVGYMLWGGGAGTRVVLGVREMVAMAVLRLGWRV